MRSEATSVTQYLQELPDARRAPMTELVAFIRSSIPPGYREEMSFGMPAWVVPLEQYPDTYNKQPLGYVSLASQKQTMSLYLGMSCRCVGLDTETVLREAWVRAGKRLDMGRACLRFKRLEDLEFDALKTVLSSTPVDDFIAEYERARAEHTAEGRRKAAKEQAGEKKADGASKAVAKPARAKPARARPAKAVSKPARRSTAKSVGTAPKTTRSKSARRSD